MKLTKQEKKIADILAKIIVIELAILFYILRFFVKTTYKLKRYLFRLAIVIFIFYNAYPVLHLVAYAPYANASEFRYTQKPQTEQEQIVNYIYDRFGKDSSDAFKVFKCESGLRPHAFHQNWTDNWDYGIAQINTVHKVPERFLYDWHVNIDVAYVIFKEQGWTPWTCKYVLK